MTAAAAAASIISNHHTNKFFASAIRRTNRRGTETGSSSSSSSSRISGDKSISNAAVKSQLRKDMNSINLWNFRSMSNLQVPSSSLLSHRVVTSAGDTSDLNEIATMATTTTTTRSRRRGMNHRRNTNNNDGDTDVTAITPTSSSSMRRATKGNPVDPLDDPNYTSSLEEMRAALGPIGRLVANSVEVGVATAGSYISGGCFGYIIGGAMGSPNLFRKNGVPPPTPPPLSNGSLPPIDINTANNLGGGSIPNRLKGLNAKAMGTAGSWAQLSAAFSGFHALTRVCRGGVEDKWNGLIGSALSGAYLSRSGGPKAMVQGAATYAGFTYMIDVVFG
eukprot:CAMPEP_0198256462 /NCGR_PEP_ID=MMETSP1447-20131203/6383_1 /TAXON_ID=420782 /ORGANISM="Chaetoceros dichaeta, Strain CCMP1751" /LENGTH=333 /DNA_ID=CAMNT_0043943121 /DNA_START=145 /DNA_END=1142 /DNA_ORIENTATION=+